jgi:putative tryptophan/tyrosine transport system substrate-binding protein
LPELAAELVQRRVAVIAATGGAPPAFAAKAATTTIPIVFDVTEDPVKLGLVASLARPGGNLTGIKFFATELAAKRLELLRELLPGAARIAVLVDPANATSTESSLRAVEAAARTMGVQIQVLMLTPAVRSMPPSKVLDASGLMPSLSASVPSCSTGVSNWPNWRPRHAVPAIYQDRQHTEVGGLISYGSSIVDAWRPGVYTGRILKGEKPADLPVVQASKFCANVSACISRSALGRSRRIRSSPPCRFLNGKSTIS